MEEMNFEKSMEELEKTVYELESQKLTLDESVKKFQKGMELSKRCDELLQKAEKEINILIEEANGNVREEPFQVSMTNEE